MDWVNGEVEIMERDQKVNLRSSVRRLTTTERLTL